MYLKFTTLTECENAITEINKRMNLNSNITATFAIPRQDISNDYVIPKPKQNIIDNPNDLSNMFSYEVIENVNFPIFDI